MLIIGALKKFAPPAPKSEAEGESEAKSESEPSEPEPKKRLLDSKPDAKSDRIPYLLNMYRYASFFDNSSNILVCLRHHL